MADNYTYQSHVGVSCPECGHVAFITKDGTQCRFKCDCCQKELFVPTNNIIEAKSILEGMKHE